MKCAKQISTGQIVGPTQDPWTPQALANVSALAEIPLDDLEECEATEQEWADANAPSWSEKRKKGYLSMEGYPPAADWLDGMVKGDQAQMDKYVADCLAVKDRFPKE